MTKILFYFTLGLCCIACTNNSNTDTNTTENTNITLNGPLPEPAVLTENYQTVVLKGDIPSPQKRTSGNIKEAGVAITYGSPSVRGRKIWGGLEPYDEVWRMGANEATIFEVNKDVQVEGQDLAAGKYAIFTIPTADDWTLIFNTVYEQWGAFEYEEEKDVLRVSVTPIPLSEVKEALEFIIDGNTIAMQWADIHLPFRITK